MEHQISHDDLSPIDFPPDRLPVSYNNPLNRTPFKKPEETYTSLWEFYKAAFPNSPTNDSLNNSAIELAVRAVDIACKLSDKPSNNEDLDDSIKEHYDSEAYKRDSCSPWELSTKDQLSTMKKNIEYLIKNRITSKYVYGSAITNPLMQIVDPLRAKDLEVLRYFINNPFNTKKDAARKLGCHPTTISRQLEYLKKEYGLELGCITDRWAFGFDTIILSIEPKDINKWNTFLKQIVNFPFYNKVSEDSLNGHHYISFLFPRKKSIIRRFKTSIIDFASSYFKTCNLHEGISARCFSFIEKINEAEMRLPELIQKKKTPSELLVEIPNRDRKRKILDYLNLRDLYVSMALGRDCRLNSTKLAEKVNHYNRIDMTPDEAYYRRRKLLRNEVFDTFISWFYSYRWCVLRFEVLCGITERDIFLESLLNCARGAYFISKEGLIFWLDVPINHLGIYLNYFRYLSESLGVHSYRSCISQAWTGGRSLTDIVKHWNYYDARGVRKKTLDISVDIHDYLI